MKQHLGHKVVDVEENRKEELVTNLTATIESISLTKEKIAKTQIPVDRKNEECLDKLKQEKEETLNLVRDKYDSMIREVEKQKEKSRSEIIPLNENLALLNNIKLHLDEQGITPTDIKNYQETLDQIPSEASSPVEYMEYKYYTDKQWLVSELCGKLLPRNYKMDDGQTQNLFGMPGQQSSTFSASGVFGFGKPFGSGTVTQQPFTGGVVLGTPTQKAGFSFGFSDQQPLTLAAEPAQQPESTGFTLGGGLTVADPGFPRRGAPTPEGGRQHTI